MMNFHDPSSKSAPHESQKAAANGSEATPRHSVAPLAPLEYLQNQRRGSITDPSLHAGPPKVHASPQSFRQAELATLHKSGSRSASPYVFGDATAEGGHMRKVLRSPSAEGETRKTPEGEFDYQMRRHSTDEAGAGTKRKTGARAEIDPQLGGDDGRAAKRRGSAVEGQRMGQLSLYDRRNSVPEWWGDRRDGPALPEPARAWPDAMMAPPDRRMSVPDLPAGPTRVLRSRSRPPHAPTSPADDDPPSAPSPSGSTKQLKDSASPYSRSPELRVSHKLAERKRRKEMKDLFDELRDQLPADRGMKASKWEILSKAIDFVAQLKQSHQDMAREIEMLRHELDAVRQAGGMPSFPPGPPPPHAVVYAHPGPYPLPPSGPVQQHPPPPPDASRPGSSQNIYPPGSGPSVPPGQNGNINRAEAPPT